MSLSQLPFVIHDMRAYSKLKLQAASIAAHLDFDLATEHTAECAAKRVAAVERWLQAQPLHVQLMSTDKTATLSYLVSKFENENLANPVAQASINYLPSQILNPSNANQLQGSFMNQYDLQHAAEVVDGYFLNTGMPRLTTVEEFVKAKVECVGALERRLANVRSLTLEEFCRQTKRTALLAAERSNEIVSDDDADVIVRGHPGGYFVIVNHDQSCHHCLTLVEAKKKGQELCDAEPTETFFSIQDADGGHIEDIERSGSEMRRTNTEKARNAKLLHQLPATLWHATATENLASIAKTGLSDRSYFSSDVDVLAYYVETISDEGKVPVVIQISPGDFDSSRFAPDFPGIEEPITTVICKTEEQVHAQWASSSKDAHASIKIIGSVMFLDLIAPDRLFVADGERLISLNEFVEVVQARQTEDRITQTSDEQPKG